MAHCLILLLAPVAAHAADAHSPDAFDTAARYTPSEVERVAVPAASVSLANDAPPSSPQKPRSEQRQAQTGGGGDEELIPHLRAPKWHRLLPGMFR